MSRISKVGVALFCFGAYLGMHLPFGDLAVLFMIFVGIILFLVGDELTGERK